MTNHNIVDPKQNYHCEYLAQTSACLLSLTGSLSKRSLFDAKIAIYMPLIACCMPPLD
jgi:hypothetical protein